MKKRINNLIRLFATVMTLSVVCSSGVTTAAEEADPTIEEGYTEKYDTYYSVVSWCKNGDMNIYGEFYYPDDFDENRTWPIVIMSHGGSVTHEIYEKTGWVEYVTSLGYVCYTFDFCGGSQKSLSDGVLEEYMSPSTEVSDLQAVMDFIETQSFYEPDKLFLMGQSFGGFITGITAGSRNDEISGIILLYPAFLVAKDNSPEQSAEADIKEEGGGGDAGNEHPESYYTELAEMDLAAELSSYTGDVLIIHGEADRTTPLSDSIDAVENIYAAGQAELVTITGEKSMHAFELIDPDGKATAQEAVKLFLTSH